MNVVRHYHVSVQLKLALSVAYVEGSFDKFRNFRLLQPQRTCLLQIENPIRGSKCLTGSLLLCLRRAAFCDCRQRTSQSPGDEDRRVAGEPVRKVAPVVNHAAQLSQHRQSCKCGVAQTISLEWHRQSCLCSYDCLFAIAKRRNRIEPRTQFLLVDTRGHL